MHNFDEYTLIVKETPKDYHEMIPQRRFIAHLNEVPAASLHEYGKTQEKAVKHLRRAFSGFVSNCLMQGYAIPSPQEEDLAEFSGKIVLRMPPWLHRDVEKHAAQDNTSINSYVVNRLIKATTIEAAASYFLRLQEQFINQLPYRFQMSKPTIAKESDMPTFPELHPNTVYKLLKKSA